MKNADDLIEAYVSAGFTKIHLDCSMPCADDPEVLTDEIVAGRAARLAAVAERTASSRQGGSELLYVVGTEVPVPGGAHERPEELTQTSAEAAKATLDAHERAFTKAGLEDAWRRVIALVVQPGVEFDHDRVIDYERTTTNGLRTVLDDHEHLVFEAHSTDYQTRENLAALVEGHWAVLKVGPALTFALREALFALAAVEDELFTDGERSDLLSVIERRMLAEPGKWERYYPGGPEEQRLLRRYSYSDRIRYYWSDDKIRAARNRLLSNLGNREIPLPLLSQHLPLQYERVRNGKLEPVPEAIIMDHIRDALKDYAFACKPRTQEVGK